MTTSPIFKDIKTEAKFWQQEDSTKYIDWHKAVLTSFSNLKFSAETISLRLLPSFCCNIMDKHL